MHCASLRASQFVKKVFLTNWWTGEYLPRHYHPLNAPEPPQSGVSGSAALESGGFRRAGRTCTLCMGATAFQILLESFGFRPQNLQGSDFSMKNQLRGRRTRRRPRLKSERASALSRSPWVFRQSKGRETMHCASLRAPFLHRNAAPSSGCAPDPPADGGDGDLIERRRQREERKNCGAAENFSPCTAT